MRKFLLAGAALLAIEGAAHADVLPILNAAGQASQATGAPAGTGVLPGTILGPDGGGGLTTGLVSFTLGGAANVNIVIQDCCRVGDVFQAAVDGTFVGETSGVPLDGPTGSSGSFFVSLAGGTHTLGIEDIILSYEGFSDPFGGGFVPSGDDLASIDPAGFSYSVCIGACSVPEPLSTALLGVGLVGLGVARRVRRK